ncbi:hypothetical protein OEZ85_009771 [Tetradesmus obliquus]|uniref:Cilia- and flagella-associated protein 57 n=1 Tax=Tetradesmus obliquus TaxID=3088 RepID=A0ABY8UCW0_TETOB|nr:hypothetical protein OEZ85_009771 [Tetradesmus obliquus]
MAAALGLVPRIVFGFSSTVRDNLHYTDDGSYLYPAGHNVVIVSPDGKSHKFVSGSPECEGITAIMLSPNKKLLAVAERAEKAVISVYDMQTLKRRKQLLAADVGSKGTEPRATFSVDEGHSVESLAAYSKGFVAGLDGGLVALFDRDEREYYRRTRTFTVMEHFLPVRGLAISSSEEQLALSLLGGPAFTLALNNQELMKTDEMNFELLGPGVHTAGEFYEVKCHEGPVARLRVSYDDFLLVSAGEDGSVVMLDIRDKELAKASSRQQQEKLPWSEEVLVSKSELEERRNHVAELEQQVAELTMQTEYQLRLKELHLQEKVKELHDKFNSELEADRQKFDMLLQEKNEQEVEYEEKLRQAELRHSSQLSALDAQYQSKMMAEVERYQQLLQEKEALNERWDEQNALLVESHERVIAELAEEAEAKLAEEVLAAEALRQEKEGLEKEAAETKRQLEEDADREIEELKEKYEQRLAAEREACLRLKGENGIMRKKFQALQKDIEEQREQLSLQHEQQKELYTTIKGLEKDIGGLKREIRERDETIGDKERRIYELKKKNQELEKFKFVLDYKIKELKKQIEPREVEIGEMKETIRAMDSELERYHKSNAGLDLTIQNLRLKEQGLQSEVISQRGTRADTESLVKKMQFEIAEVAGVIQDPKALKEKVKALYQRHCVDPATGPGSPTAASRGATLTSKGVIAAGPAAQSGEVNSEYTRQRNYLEKTIDSLKRKLAADSEAHRADELRIMSQNVSLIRELNELRREIKRVLSRPGSSNAGGSSSRSGGVGRAASGLSAGNVDSREQELRSAGGMEPTPWETAGEGVGDADAGEEWAGQQQPDIVEQQQTANDSLAQQQTVLVD